MVMYSLLLLLPLWIDGTSGQVVPVKVKKLEETATAQQERIDNLAMKYQGICQRMELTNRHNYRVEKADDPKPENPEPRQGYLTFEKAYQSTASYNAHKAIDGNASPHYPYGGCTHTASGQQFNWWMGKLRYYSRVDSVLVTNRGDCCGWRLRDFEIQGFSLNPVDVPSQKPTTCAKYGGTVPSGSTVSITCNTPFYAQFLRLYKKGSDPLTICEFVAKGDPVPDMDLLLKSSFLQSFNTRSTTTALGWRAVDGNPDSCAETDERDLNHHWWEIDLKQTKTIEGVTIFNRDDSKSDWLREITVIVYEKIPTTCTNASGQQICAERAAKVSNGEKVTLTCTTPVKGQFLRIWKTNRAGESLRLCEVEIKTQ